MARPGASASMHRKLVLYVTEIYIQLCIIHAHHNLLDTSICLPCCGSSELITHMITHRQQHACAASHKRALLHTDDVVEPSPPPRCSLGINKGEGERGGIIQCMMDLCSSARRAE